MVKRLITTRIHLLVPALSAGSITTLPAYRGLYFYCCISVGPLPPPPVFLGLAFARTQLSPRGCFSSSEYKSSEGMQLQDALKIFDG